MAKPKPSNELPATISLSTLRWILGDVTTEYCNQLERQGLLEKVSRGTYTTASIRSYVRATRERTLGPQAWNQARTELARERAASARLDRQERERRVIPVDEVRACWTEIARVIRDRVLGLARKVAPRLVGLKSASEVEAILYSECVEALEELSRMTIAMKTPNGKQQRYDKSIGTC
jgi:hypothetical protein